MAWVEKLPSGRYRAVFRDSDGRKVSAGIHTHKGAALAAAAIAEKEALASPGKRPDMEWGRWADQWWANRAVEPSTLEREATMRVKHIDDYWASVPLSQITRHDIRDWAVGLTRTSGLAMSSARRITNILSASLAAAVDAGHLDANPAARLRLPTVQVDNNRYLTREQARALVDEAPEPRDAAIIQTFLGTGMRWGELNGLQVERVDLQRRTVRIAEVFDSRRRVLKAYPKDRRFRSVPLPDWAAEQLEPYLWRRRSGFVFETGGHPLDYSNWRKKAWLPAVALAEVAPLRIHDLRHTYASWLIQDGFSLPEVGKLLGHEDPSTTQIYAHLIDDVAPERLSRALRAF